MKLADVAVWPVASFRGNAGRLSLSERSGHEPTGQIGHMVMNDPQRKSD